MRAVLRIIFSLCGLVVFAVAAVLGINAFDQDLSADAKRLITAPRTAVPPGENLYVAMVGFNAPADVHMAAAGQMRIAAHELGTRPEYATHSTPSLAFKGKADLCNPAVRSCIEVVRAHSVEILQQAVENVELYRRYLQLHDLPRFEEVQSHTQDRLSMHVPPAVRNLFLAYTLWRVTHAADAGERTAALADLRRDIETWRRMLIGEGSLRAKTLAMDYLHADYALLADIVGDPAIDLAPHAEDIEAMFSVLRMEDWQIPEVFETEFRPSARMYEELREQKRATGNGESAWSRFTELGSAYFFLPNATQNLNAAYMREWQRVARTEPRLYHAALQQLKQWRNDKIEFHAHWIYNPIGKVLLTVAKPSYERELQRAYDIAAFQQLVRMAYDLRMQKVTAAGVRAHLERFPDLARHPIDGSWFQWSPQTRQLSMKPLGDQPRVRRFAVPVVPSA